jgi:hypothetical protein
MGAVIRLAAMPGIKRLTPLLALLAVLATLSGCGSDELSGEIPQENADALISALREVNGAIALDDCDGASSAAQDFGEFVDQLPATAGAELKTALREAGDNLEGLVSQECASTGSTSTTSTQPTTEPTTSSTTEETEPTTTDETTTTTTTTEETTPDEDGSGPPGNGPPGGDGPPGQDGGTGGTGSGSGDETDG